MTDIDHLKDYHVRGRKFGLTSAITTLDRSSENVVYFPYLLDTFTLLALFLMNTGSECW